MKIADNSLAAVKRYFLNELSALYDQREVLRFFEWTVEHYFGWKPHDLITGGEKRLTESQLLRLIGVVKGLKKERPIQYLLGSAHFYGLELEVNEAVLIPRPETEELADWIVKTVKDGNSLRFLDIGTGSGCIALALKSACPEAEVKGVDVSEAALALARRNASRLGLKVVLVQADIFDPAFEAGGKADVIVSNPPYVKRSEKALMKRNVLEYEPHLALFVPDEDPLLFYNRIADVAWNLLKEGGWLFFEINEGLWREVEELLTDKGFHAIELKKDLNGKYRMIRCRR